MSITKTIMLFRDIIAVYFDKYTKLISTVCGQNFITLKQVVHVINTVLLRGNGVLAIFLIIEGGP
jgi:hypothetical protein